MKTFIKNLRGVSNIVGALMLVLIVVTASASLAIFISQRQEARQGQEMAELMKELENLEIQTIENIEYNDTDFLKEVTFSIASIHNRESRILSLDINNYFVKKFNCTYQDSTQTPWIFTGEKLKIDAVYANDSSGEPYIFKDLNRNDRWDTFEEIYDKNPDRNDVDASPSESNYFYAYALDEKNEPYLFWDNNTDNKYSAGEDIFDDNPDDDDKIANASVGYDKEIPYPTQDRFTIEPKEQITIHISDIKNNLINSDIKLYKNDPLTFVASTILANKFEKTFYPPTPVILLDVDSYRNNTGAYKQYYILDGSKSDQPGEDAYITRWNWNITNSALPKTDPNKYLKPEPTGRITQITNASFIKSNNKYYINLTVTDNYGMKGTRSFLFQA